MKLKIFRFGRPSNDVKDDSLFVRIHAENRVTTTRGPSIWDVMAGEFGDTRPGCSLWLCGI